MKFNKWTLGLAAVGAVSLASVAQAEEKANPLLTAVSSTSLSGYVDTSIHWNPGTGNANQPGYSFNTPGKADGFNLDSILVRLQKPLDETEWAAGYDVDLFFGPDANFLGTTPLGGLAGTDFAIKQAYVSLRTPIGTGIDWKLGVFDNWIGYESTETPNNPNYTRSYGYTLEPTTFTGLMGTYKITDMLSASAGIANTTGPVIGGGNIGGGLFPVSVGRANPPKAESYKTYMASGAFTAPNDWGSFGGSTFYAGVINGWGGGAAATGTQTDFYLGATINTPVAGLKAGVSYDYFGKQSQTYTPVAGGVAGPLIIPESWADDIALYASYQATEKLSIHGRGEYLWQSEGIGTGNGGPITGPSKVLALTATVQYDLWKNVISRLEFRWDHQAGNVAGFTGAGNPNAYGGTLVPINPVNAGVAPTGGPSRQNIYLIAANIIYKF